MTDTLPIPITRAAVAAAPPLTAPTTRHRSVAIDAVRVLGITAVVIGHSWDHTWLNLSTYTWHVPLFFFLSGYLWNPRRRGKDELRSRWRSLGVPYLAWFAVIAVIFGIVDIFRGNAVGLDVISGLLYGGYFAVSPYTTFWFVSALFFTVLWTRLLWNAGRVWLACGIIGGLIAGPTLGWVLARTPLSIGTALACLPLVAAGMLARSLHHRIHRPLLLGAGLLLVSATLIVTRVSRSIDIRSGDYGTPVLSLLVASMICFGLLLVAEVALATASERAGRLISVLAQAGLVTVLLHPLMMWIVYSPEMTGIDFAFILVVPWLIGLAVLRVRAVAAPLLGVHRAARAASADPAPEPPRADTQESGFVARVDGQSSRAFGA